MVKSLLQQREELSLTPRTRVCLFFKVGYCGLCNPIPEKVETGAALGLTGQPIWLVRDQISEVKIEWGGRRHLLLTSGLQRHAHIVTKCLVYVNCTHLWHCTLLP